MTIKYQIRNSQGVLFVELPEGFVDNTSSSLSFVGKNVSNFGTIQNTNFLKLLENFASTTPPTAPVPGQLWWNKSTNMMNVYDETHHFVELATGSGGSSGGGGSTATTTATVTPPGGQNTQVQFNNNGEFGGSSAFTFNTATNSVSLESIVTTSTLRVTVDTGPIKSWFIFYGDFAAGQEDNYISGTVFDSVGNLYAVSADGNLGVPYLTKFSPDGDVVWQKAFTDPGNLYKTCDTLIVDSSDNVIISVGIDDTETNVTLIKLDPDGNVLQQVTIDNSEPGSNSFTIVDLSIDSANNVYAATLSYLAGPNRAGVIKLNPAGELQWARALTSAQAMPTYPQGIAVDSTGNVYISSQAHNNSAYGVITARRMTIVKYDTNGNLLWQKQYGNMQGDDTSSGLVTIDSSDNIYISTSWYSNGQSAILLKCDPLGEIIWQDTVNVSATIVNPYIAGIELDDLGNVYIAGQCGRYNDPNAYDLFLAKYNANGVIQWARTIGTTDNDYQYYYWATRNLSIFQTRAIVSGYSYVNGANNSEALLMQVQTDGSGTGTYGFMHYLESTLTNVTSSTFVVNLGDMTSTDSTSDHTLTSGTYVVSTSAEVSTKTVVGTGGIRNWEFTDTGETKLPGFSLPSSSGAIGAVLVAASNGTTAWGAPSIQLDSRHSLSIGGGLAVSTGCQNFAIGYCALAINGNGSNNVAIGECSLACNIFGTQNIAVGHNALHFNCNGSQNIAIGGYGLFDNCYGINNVAIGYTALQGNCGGDNNVAIGYATLCANGQGSRNIAIGLCALSVNSGGNFNIALGTHALKSNTIGSSNIAQGYCALKSNTIGYNNIAIGDLSLNSNISGINNVAIGPGALYANTCGCQNIAVGNTSLYNNTYGFNNIAVGQFSLANNTIGDNNVAIGVCALYSNNAGYNNVAVGCNSLYQNTCGRNNIGIGCNTLYSNKSGFNNIAIGNNALTCNISGTDNIAIGQWALGANDRGCHNTALGCYALKCTTCGNNNVAVGGSALLYNIAGSNNTAFGFSALCNSRYGNNNTAIGMCSLSQNTYGNDNTAIGVCSLSVNTLGHDNTAIGNGAMLNNTCGCYNTAIGASALISNITGNNNIAIGQGSLAWNTTGILNVAQGYKSLFCNSGGQTNIAIGNKPLYKNSIGTGNVAIGGLSLYGNTTGSGNIAIGAFTAFSNTFGNNIVAVGDSALCLNTTGCCNTAIGVNAGSTNTSGINNTFIGFGAQPVSAITNNSITLGNASVATIRAQVTTITALSDCRDKTNIVGIPIGLNFIKEVNPVQFTWNMRDGAKVGIDEMGFIAQELDALQQKYNVKDSLNLILDENPERLEATPGKLLPVLVKAIQDLALENEVLRADLVSVKAEIAAINAKLI